MSMNPERWQRVCALVNKAEAMSVAQRDSFLAAECASDPALRAEVESLLKAGLTDAGRMHAAERAVGAAFGRCPGESDLVGQTIGHYTIKRLIASGGMGTVYEAVQEQPRRTVALKLMKRSLVSRVAIRRFEYESQVLGRLRHPGIAQVYESGTHDDGRGEVPYFAMEYIPNAEPVNEHAWSRKLDLQARLVLFAKVCDAVHHGHQKGIIHRDLKPGNILVDSDGEPKVIDFGVARATDSDLALTTLQTNVGQLIGTLQYMSPEQCDADPHDLDTRSDVYALGVILYELLCERLPYDLGKAAVHEAARIIREEAPERPSTANRTLRGDIETIALKAIEKNRDRRYRSAAELADDIGRYLRHEPITARPPSFIYQVRMLARRNAPQVYGAVAAVIALALGFAGTVYGLSRAIEAEREATRRAGELERVVAFQASMLEGVDPHAMGVKLREALADEVLQACKDARLDETDRADRLESFRLVIHGVNFTNLGVGSLQQVILNRALDAAERDFKAEPVVQAALFQAVASVQLAYGLLDDAAATQKRAFDIRRSRLGPQHPHTLISMCGYGELLVRQGQFAEAQPLLQEAVSVHQSVFGVADPRTIAAEQNLGAALLGDGEFAAAEAVLRASAERCRTALGMDNAQTLTCITNLGVLLHAQGRMAEAEPLLIDALAGRCRVLGQAHRDTVESFNNLAVFRTAQRQFEESASLYRDGIAAAREILGDDHPTTLMLAANLSAAHFQLGEVEVAEEMARSVLQGRRIVLGNLHPQTLESIVNLSAMLRQSGKLDESEDMAREALAGFEQIGNRQDWRIGNSHMALGITLGEQSRFAEAAMHLEKAEQLLRIAQGVPPGRLAMCLERSAELHDDWHAAEPHQGHDQVAVAIRQRAAQQATAEAAQIQR